MADTFQVVTQRPTLIALGGTKTLPGVEVGIVTRPSGIDIEFTVPQKGYSAQIVNAAALGWADIYETLAGLPHVSGVAWGQEQDASGNLVPIATITVESTSGNSEGQLAYKVSDLGPKLHQAQIDALHSQLDAAEAL